MNEYIISDIQNGISYLRCAIMNIIASDESIEVKHLPYSLIKECLLDCGYVLRGKQVIFADFTTWWYKQGVLLEIKIDLDNGKIKFTKT